MDDGASANGSSAPGTAGVRPARPAPSQPSTPHAPRPAAANSAIGYGRIIKSSSPRGIRTNIRTRSQAALMANDADTERGWLSSFQSSSGGSPARRFGSATSCLPDRNPARQSPAVWRLPGPSAAPQLGRTVPGDERGCLNGRARVSVRRRESGHDRSKDLGSDLGIDGGYDGDSASVCECVRMC